MTSHASTLLARYGLFSVALLALAAATGVLLRFGLIGGMPAWAQNLSAVRHAHSHLMYFGWVTPALMAFIWRSLPALTGRPLPRGIPAQMTTTVVLALLSFPAFWSNGYGLTQVGSLELPLGAMISGLCGLTWYWFILLYVRATWRLSQRPLAVRLWDWALVLVLLASLGAVGLMGMVLLDAGSVVLQQLFLHLFLDLFAVGWFELALLGILWAWLEEQAPAPPRLPVMPLAVALGPTFVLGMSPTLVPPATFWPAALANAAAAVMLGWHGWALWQRRSHLPPAGRFGLLFFGLHILSAGPLLWPGFWQWAGGTQLRVYFLHAFLLGWVSSALLALLYSEVGRLSSVEQQWVSVVWGAGVGVMLIALLAIGFIQFVPVRAGDMLRVAAWASILPGLVALWSVWRLAPPMSRRSAGPERLEQSAD